MTHTLIIRGFDDQVHEQLGEIANKRGVSVNSIVKDAVDMWLKKKESEVPRKHHLVIYSDDESIIRLLKSMDRFAKEDDLFRCFLGLLIVSQLNFCLNLNGMMERLSHIIILLLKSIRRRRNHKYKPKHNFKVKKILSSIVTK